MIGIESSSEPVATGHRVLPRSMHEFCLISLLMTVATAFYCLIARLVFHKHSPWDWPMFNRHESFTDFTIYQPKFVYFHSLEFFRQGYPFTYPSPMAMLYELLFRLPGKEALWAFLGIMLAAYITAGILLARALQHRGIKTPAAWAFACITVFLSWPAAMLFDRGNVEIFVWIALALGVWAYAKGREWSAAAMFGVAASLKLFPFVYLALFLNRRKFPKLLFGATVFIAITAISLVILGPTMSIAYQGIRNGLQMFQLGYVDIYNGTLTGYDHSLLGLIKTVIAAVEKKHYESLIVRIASLYTPVMAVVGLTLYVLVLRKLPWLNQLLAFTIVSILFTPFSGDGTLIHLYYAFALCVFLAVDAWRKGLSIPGLRWITWCFAFLFSVQNYYIAVNRRYEAQTRCLVLVVLLILAMRYPLSAPLAKGAEPAELSLPDASRIADSEPSVA